MMVAVSLLVRTQRGGSGWVPRASGGCVPRRLFSSGGELVQFDVTSSSCVGRVTLNNPKRRNALSLQVLKELLHHLEEVERTKAVRVVVLKGAGPVFSSGHDLKELAAAQQRGDTQFITTLFAICTQVMEKIRLLPVPVIAQVNGLATAAGCQLAASCDMVIASRGAVFQTPGVQIGLFCTTPGVAVARHISSNKRALEMLLTGEPISAEEAVAFGLANRVVDEEDIDIATLDLAHKVIRTPANILALGKKAFYEQISKPIPEAYKLAESYMVENAMLDETKEGVNAFLEKRTPSWKK